MQEIQHHIGVQEEAGSDGEEDGLVDVLDLEEGEALAEVEDLEEDGGK